MSATGRPILRLNYPPQKPQPGQRRQPKPDPVPPAPVNPQHSAGMLQPPRLGTLDAYDGIEIWNVRHEPVGFRIAFFDCAVPALGIGLVDLTLSTNAAGTWTINLPQRPVCDAAGNVVRDEAGKRLWRPSVRLHPNVARKFLASVKSALCHVRPDLFVRHEAPTADSIIAEPDEPVGEAPV